jgi:prepilin-type N-terminal cleavage/methylation domain-containing protein
MRTPRSPRRPAFTLVEMLVVIGIIVVLVALLVPAAAIAVSRVRNFNMTAEISQLATAIETYKKEKGDYPPSMGELDVNDADGDGDVTESIYPVAPYTSVCERHLQKCFPKMRNEDKVAFYRDMAPYMTQAEALWFWLSQTQNDERQPFFSTSKNYKQYYDFKQERVVQTKTLQVDVNSNGNPVPFVMNAYKPNFAKDTAFVYIDSRTYAHHSLASRAASIDNVAAGFVQPYGDYVKAQEVKANSQKIQNMTVLQRMAYQYMNPTTFQILSAGQDGEWGPVSDQFNATGYPLEVNGTINQGLRQFKEGIGYNDGDKDNLTNFSEGRRLEDHIP